MNNNTFMTDRETSINSFYDLLNKISLEGLIKSNQVYTCEHKDYPIVILNHKSSFKSKETCFDACRGLIIEKEYPHKVVSRGFDKFKHYKNSNNILINRATIKEDGSLIFLFRIKHGNVYKWLLSTMHDFADNKLQFGEMTYEELFKNIINEPLDDFANKLVEQCNPNITTFCFEMCSQYNKVIKEYKTPTLFLITAFGYSNSSIEISIPRGLSLPDNVKQIVEIDIKENITFDDINLKIEEYVANDFSFEGFVLEIIDNGIVRRIKAKNRYYLIKHILKYRGWISATPKLIIPLIFNGVDELILSELDEYDLLSRTCKNEIIKHRDYYKNIIESEKNNIINLVSTLIDFSISDYIKKISHLNKNLKSLLISIYNGYFNEKLFEKYIMENISKLLNNPFISKLDKVNHYDYIDQDNNGLSKNKYLCYCGENMVFTRLKADLTIYKSFNNINYGTKTYRSGNNLMICNSCLCTHEINKITNEPLGIPCSHYCKSLRLYIHHLMDRLSFENKITKSEFYKSIELILNCDEEEAHMAKLGIEECYKIIKHYSV